MGSLIDDSHQVVSYTKTPLKSPLVQGGTFFLSNVAPRRGMKNSLAGLILPAAAYRRILRWAKTKTSREHACSICFESKPDEPNVNINLTDCLVPRLFRISVNAGVRPKAAAA